ncbi:MAG: FtsX-like permease family protein [Bacteroidota bacterium]
MVSVVGVTIGTMALVIVLSAFNGFDEMIRATYNSFDPDLNITPHKGKTFEPTKDSLLQKVKKMDEVAVFSEIVEENALIHYDEKQHLGQIKGVDSQFEKLSGVDSMIVGGKFSLHNENRQLAVVGRGVQLRLSLSLNYMEPLIIYVPERGRSLGANPNKAFKRKPIFTSGVFSTQREYDMEYVIVPIEFARDLLDYKTEATKVEINIKEDANLKRTQNKIQSILGSDYDVQNRYQMHEALYKVMESEKWSIFMILTFILIVASFNILGSLTMLIIDKKQDIMILRNLGANLKTIRRIFFLEGWLISIIGSVIGVGLGIFVCWIQEYFGLIKLGQGGNFITDHYPVDIQLMDIFGIFLTVLIIGFLVSYFPVRYITKHYIVNEKTE